MCVFSSNLGASNTDATSEPGRKPFVSRRLSNELPRGELARPIRMMEGGDQTGNIDSLWHRTFLYQPMMCSGPVGVFAFF